MPASMRFLLLSIILENLLHEGLPLVFEKILPGFLNSLRVFESTRFWVFISLKSSLTLKTVSSSIITLKRYCNANLTFFF